jgi:DNA ligase-1
LKTYDTLYSRTSDGSVQIWYMQQDGNKYRSVSGRQDGKHVESAWTQVDGKNSGRANATSDVEQCTKEIQSKYKKQRKTGYFDDLSQIDTALFFEPMLAKKYSDERQRINWASGVGVQIKLNGSRMIATKAGLFTRQGEKYTSVPHIEQALKPFFEKYPNAVLDGECFNYDLREKLNELMSLVRKTVNITQADTARSREIVRYYVYDGFGCGASESDGYMKRKTALDVALTREKIDFIEDVETFIVHSEEAFLTLYNSFLEDRQEGAMVRILDKPYENKRSKYLLKYKPTMDSEFEIVAITEGKGNWAGRARIITLKMEDGRLFDADFKGTMEEAEQFLKDSKKYVGKRVTIFYNAFTGLGIPNYAKLDYNNFIPSTK